VEISLYFKDGVEYGELLGMALGKQKAHETVPCHAMQAPWTPVMKDIFERKMMKYIFREK
jgi:hypothetical protein